MSENMEREKNERLTSRELEEEEAEMKRELAGMGMYEPGYTYKDMKAILGFISESKDMAKMGAESKNTQKESLHASNSYKSEDVTKIASPQDSESKEHIELPKASYSYRTGHVSPTAFDRISTCGSSSPESLMFELKSSVNRHKNADCDEVFDRLQENAKTRDTRNTNKYITLRSHNISQDSQSTSSVDGKVDAQLEHSQLLDRWRIDPFDVPVCEDDVPLQGPTRRPVHERVPFRHCREAQTPEKREKTIIELSAHMKEMADLWHSWHRTTDPKFRWGSPIQVGTANGSLEKNPLKATNAGHGSADNASKDNHERVCKRKALIGITSITKTASTDEDDGNDDNDEEEYFVSVKRRKAATKLSKPLRSNRLDRKKPSSSGAADGTTYLDDDEAGSHEITVRIEETGTESKSTSPTRTYPRRIIPPNPKANTSRSKKLQSTSLKAEELQSRLKHSANSQKAVDKESNRPEKSQSVDVEKSAKQSETVELKLLRLKGLSVRLQRQCAILKEMNALQEQKPSREEEPAGKGEEERRQREDFRRRQLLEVENERKKESKARRVEVEKGAKYNEMLQLRQKECRVKLTRCREAEEKKRLEKEEEDRLLADSDEEIAVATVSLSAEQTSCPICCVPFPNDKIEAHAAECKQYVASPSLEKKIPAHGKRAAKNVTSRGILLECSICSTFKTSDGNEYESHVNRCLQRKERQSNRSPETTINLLNRLPGSPINCFRPISEQTDSEINYKAQFATSSRTYGSRKRKQ